jgi:hypothetical protein
MLFRLADAPDTAIPLEPVNSRMSLETAIYSLLAKAYPESLTVFEVAVDLAKSGRSVPLGLDDQHSTIYKLMSGGRRFRCMSPLPQSGTAR